VLRRVAEGVLVHQSPLLRNNAVVVHGEAGVLLVDPGLTRDEMACLAGDLRALGRPVVVGFSTHPDWDHVLWHADFGDAPRYGTAGCADVLRELRSHRGWQTGVAQGLPPEIAHQVPLELFGLVTGLPPGATQIPWDGPAARVVEHRAHARGHAALVISEHRVLVAGDMLSDVLVPMLDDTTDPVGDYLEGLRVLEDTVDDVDVVIPGHGSVGTADQARARVGQDRAYVLALREGRVPRDPRVESPSTGWEWVSGVHDAQVQRLAAGGAAT